MLQPVGVGHKTLADYTHLVGRPLLGSGAEFQMSIVTSANPGLHAAVLAEIDAGVGRLANRAGRL